MHTTKQQQSHSLQQRIGAELGVTADFDPQAEIERRVAFLADYLSHTGRKGYVLGISGGVDSLLAGQLCQRAVERVRRQGGTRPACDALFGSLRGGVEFRDAGHEDFVMGNIKARQRMIAQYAVAGACDGLVVGTDQAAEALMGFFTKFGDGAADVVPLTGLTKRRVRALATALGAPPELVMKVPTADLETLKPLRPDEDAFGVSYEEIDNYLEGKPVPEASARIIERQWFATMHKRALPLAPGAGEAVGEPFSGAGT